jgi:hypothetical protein
MAQSGLFFTSTLRPTWTVLEETRMAQSGLFLRPISLAEVDQLGGRQPEWILVSEEYKKITIVDLCRPSDLHHAQWLTAAMQKQQTYHPLVEGLGHYNEQG